MRPTGRASLFCSDDEDASEKQQKIDANFRGAFDVLLVSILHQAGVRGIGGSDSWAFW
jgi:hypothetical protein